MLPLPTHGVSGEPLPTRSIRSVLSEAVIAAFSAQYDGTMATARRLAGQLGQPVNVVIAWAQELGIAEGAIAREVERRNRVAVEAVKASMEPKKRCVACGEERVLTQFRKGGRAPDGYANTCLVCRPMGPARAHQVKQAEALTPAPAEIAPAVTRPMGAERVVRLQSGATLTVWFAGNLLTVPKAEREFVVSLIETIERYEDEQAS